MIFLSLFITLDTGFAATDNSSSSIITNYEGNNQSTTENSINYAAGSTNSVITVKVLIYNGNYAASSCVNGIKTSLDSANTNNLVPGYYFSYATSTVINSSTLSGYDVLAMPGGSGGYYYLNSSNISGSAIKSFVSNGGGYLGICAGAYSAAYYTQDYYNGWGLAPNVTCTHPNHEGDLTVQITSTGEDVLGINGIVTLAHYNGPAMYASGNAIVFATYADNIIKSNGMAAIVGDFYGQGRVVLSGPHPELDPQVPIIIANLIVWAANYSGTPVDTSSLASIAQIGSAAASVKSQYEANKVLPSSITVNGNQLTMAQFAYLLASATVNLNSGSTAPITIENVDAALSPSGSIKSGSVYKSEFVSMAQSLLSYVSVNGKAPNYLTSSLGNMDFTNLVYMYSKILNYYQSYSRLPNYVSMTASSSGTTPTPTPTTTVTMSQVGSAAATVKSYFETNKTLPGSVTIASQSVSMPSLLNLLTIATIQANTGSTSAITLKTVNTATSPSGTIKSGNIMKTEFITLAQTITSYITTNNKAPDYVTCSLGNLSFQNALYMYSKIMNLYKTN
ncbi:MAG: BPL-N domain-containing protein, partial [Methanobacterium sp.]|nr:BPL-N domain-containing protein [Methanobacterium sp.]